MSLPHLLLKKNEDHRLRQGHLWVFSNEVDCQATPLKAFAPGDLAAIGDSAGHFIGIGYVNPYALICARLLSRNPRESIDFSFWRQRLAAALTWREKLFSTPFYRLVHGEGDLLPGLIIDRFDQVCVIQCNTAGIECQLEDIVRALEELVRPKAIVLRNDSASRALENLPSQIEILGKLPELVLAEENGFWFQVNPCTGQKTGWFYDQRPNRVLAASLARGLKVLDLFCYVGAFAIQAAAAGARQVIAVDGSATALEQAKENAHRNGVADKIQFIHADAFEFLQASRGERFDLIFSDPPAFIKRRQSLAKGIAGYRRLHKLAIPCLAKPAILVSCSCSYHLQAHMLKHLVAEAALKNTREAALFVQGHQGPDHPIHPAIPETEYLKAQFYHLL
ncbi:MAG: class I SAM-dependent rRNA methyltransferase [Methylohalobius sp.]|nr:class I SAM-dependent rRNA methyltransferase [Methylohalobius sp.]